MAIIDIGSNTIRLVIYNYSTISGLKELDNIKAVARLRTYINTDGIMEEKGIQILENLLLSFKEMLSDFEVESVRAVATASLRQSSNSADIIERMLHKTGIKIALLTEQEEAYYGYFAVTHTISTPSAVTVDMGGGSTEITYYKDKELQDSISLPFGSVSLKQQFMTDNTMTAKERERIYSFAFEQFSSIEWLEKLQVPVVGIGGSARSMAKLDQSRKNYPLTGVHQYRMSKDDFIEINEELASLSYAELKKLDGLSSDRADIIGPVAEVFRALMDCVESKKFQFSRKGLREGLVMSEILTMYPKAFNKYDVFLTGVKYLAEEFGKYEEQIIHHAQLAELLYEKLCIKGLWTSSQEEIHILKQGAKVFALGEYIEQDAASQHTFYLLSNRSINGLNHKERVRLALLASYKNKEELLKFLKPFENWFSKEEIQQLLKLGAFLKLVYALDASKRGVVTNIDVDLNDKKEDLILTVTCKANPLAEEYQVNRQKKHLERIIKKDIILKFV